jgi:tetratricopeptide (TPR) repeat protein
MKTWFASSLLALIWASPAWAVRAQEGLACLEVSDLGCAIEVRDAVISSGDTSEAAQILNLRTLFREGRYDEAIAVLEGLHAAGSEALARETNPYRPTALASRGMVSAVDEGVEVRRAQGVEAVLESEALDVLRRGRSVYDPMFGGGPQHRVLLDIFPTAQRFIQASGLPPEAVRKTGVVALSKWSRLLISSPRALSRGYGWKDTVAHEYIHLVISVQSEDRAPVWLQEGLAKLLETRWRSPENSSLTVHQQSLLARAIKSGEFVPFEKFKHSMAYLDSGDEAALAFAQVATLVQHVLERSGESALPRIMTGIRDGEAAQWVMARAAGYPDFEALMAGWKTWLSAQPLIADEVASLPVVLDGDADDYAADPLLAADMTRARAARLGDLLLERDRPLAALIEYRKAAGDEGPPSPLMMARETRCLADLKRTDEALSLSERGVSLYPEFTLLWVTRARLLAELGQAQGAVSAWSAAHELNPFDREVQQALVDGYSGLGEQEKADHHKRLLTILNTGGAAAMSR